MHFKNYKSSELYILLNLIHLISIPTTSLQFIMHRGIGFTHPFLISLSLSLSLRLMPDNVACTDPTTIAAARTRARTPLANCGSSHATTTAGPTFHLSQYLSSPCMATTYSYIRGK
jgi:hypothetical protein